MVERTGSAGRRGSGGAECRLALGTGGTWRGVEVNGRSWERRGSAAVEEAAESGEKTGAGRDAHPSAPEPRSAASHRGRPSDERGYRLKRPGRRRPAFRPRGATRAFRRPSSFLEKGENLGLSTRG